MTDEEKILRRTDAVIDGVCTALENGGNVIVVGEIDAAGEMKVKDVSLNLSDTTRVQLIYRFGLLLNDKPRVRAALAGVHPREIRDTH